MLFRGQWYFFIKVLRQKLLLSFNEYKYSQYLTTITHDNDFIIVTAVPDSPFRPNAAYWNKVYTPTGYLWLLSIPNSHDYGVYIVTVYEVDYNGMAVKLSGVYTESGFNPSNPAQLPTVGGVTYTKITYK